MRQQDQHKQNYKKFRIEITQIQKTLNKIQYI